MSRRLFIGGLPGDPDLVGEIKDEIRRVCSELGAISDLRVPMKPGMPRRDAGFAFVEFESTEAAEAAVDKLNGTDLMGGPIAVQFARENRREDRGGFEDRGSYGRRDDDRRGGYGDYDRPRGPAGPAPGSYSLTVRNLSRDTSWQDLKDFARQAGNVSFADVDRNDRSVGTIAYRDASESEAAVRQLNGQDLKGNIVEVTEGAPSFGGGRDSRDDRGYGGGSYRDRSPRRDDYRRDDRRDDYRRDDYRSDYRRDERRDDYRRDDYGSRRDNGYPRDRSPAPRDDYRSGGRDDAPRDSYRKTDDEPPRSDAW